MATFCGHFSLRLATRLDGFVFFCELWPISGWPLAHRWLCCQTTSRLNQAFIKTYLSHSM